MRTQFSAVSILVAALFLTTPAEAIKIPDTCGSDLAAQIASDGQLDDYTHIGDLALAQGSDGVVRDASAKAALFKTKISDMYSKPGFTKPTEKQVKDMEAIVPDKDTQFAKEEVRFNLANKIVHNTVPTGGNKRLKLCKETDGTWTTRYPYLKYDGHAFLPDDWDTELGALDQIPAKLTDGSLKTNTGGTYHVVHVITGAGTGNLSRRTRTKLTAMKTADDIMEFWESKNHATSGEPTSYFVLYKKK